LPVPEPAPPEGQVAPPVAPPQLQLTVAPAGKFVLTEALLSVVVPVLPSTSV